MSTPAPAPGIVTLEEAKSWLRLAGSNADRDAEVQRLIDAVTVLIENVVGPVRPRPDTADFHPTGRVIFLPVPLRSVTSVTAYRGGVATVFTEDDPTQPAPQYGYRLDIGPGLLEGAWPYGSTVRVTFDAGREGVPANIVQAALEQMRFWWVEGKQGAHPAFGGSDDMPDQRGAPAAGLHPWIKQQLAPHALGPALA